MKKIYLLIVVMAIACSINAQVTLTKVFNEPVLGDVNTKQIYDSVGIVPKTTGANKIWDFSSFTMNSSVEVSDFISTSSTPNGSSYSNATFVEDYGSGNYSYMKVDPISYQLLGIETPSYKLNFTSNTAVEFVWPIAMGYTHTDAFSGTANANNMNGTVSGNISTVASGTGTLIIPGGATFTGVLQIKMTLAANASFLLGFATANIRLVEYSYYEASRKFPLLTVMYTNVSGAATSKSAGIKFNAAIVGINDLNFDASFNIFPNPAKDNFNVTLSNQHQAYCDVEIIDATGQRAKVINLGNDIEISENISISNLASGMYFIKTTLGDKVSVRKFIKE